METLGYKHSYRGTNPVTEIRTIGYNLTKLVGHPSPNRLIFTSRRPPKVVGGFKPRFGRGRTRHLICPLFIEPGVLIGAGHEPLAFHGACFLRLGEDFFPYGTPILRQVPCSDGQKYEAEILTFDTDRTLQLVNGGVQLEFGVEKATCFKWWQNGDL